ncbi:MAG: protease modulator HflC [Methylomonas sp.]|nr:protease modulator HflC [Methylomonas sp.]PPD22381.1 MAG: protease modulator HflC [Methylomonas sp.]PPD25851.1 MAG: protease modulator HflC [Methylomonas sp.]PPD37300.1 MAG: protease modulator HflC [Methylomonas sp.]PPD42128.1 MAG: protease modulator HflC [Methylomonas sp.]
MVNKILVAVAAAFILLSMSMFTVSETERAIKFQLGEVVAADYEPGLHFKLPFVNNVKKFDARILTMDVTPERFLTAEKKNVIVDSFVKWRINDVKRFYTSVGGDITQANIRLDQIIKNVARGEFSRREIRQLVSTDRAVIRETLIANVARDAAGLGVEIVDVQVKRIDLPPEVSTSVFQRMEAERARVAREFRSQGAEAAERIRAAADQQRVIIMANAYRKSETLRGEGDANAADTYAKAFGQDSEFFGFYRSLQAYRQSVGKPGNIMVMEPDSDFFRYFKNQK